MLNRQIFNKDYGFTHIVTQTENCKFLAVVKGLSVSYEVWRYNSASNGELIIKTENIEKACQSYESITQK